MRALCGASLLMIIADARDGWNMNMNGFLSGSGSRRETSRGPGSVLTVAGAGDQAISRHGRPGPGQLRHRGQQRNAFSHRVRLYTQPHQMAHCPVDLSISNIRYFLGRVLTGVKVFAFASDLK